MTTVGVAKEGGGEGEKEVVDGKREEKKIKTTRSVAVVGGMQDDGKKLLLKMAALETAEEFGLGWIKSLFQPASGRSRWVVVSLYHTLKGT